MANPQENLARFQEIARRGLQDQLPDDKRAIFDEALRRGLISLPDTATSGITEPIRAIASGAARTVAGGLGGIGIAATNGVEEASEFIEQTQAEAFTPQTEAGRKNLQAIGEGVQFVMDKFNIPLSGLGGIVELVAGQGVDQAVETINKIQSEGISKALGERVFEETGSPLAATVAESAPTAMAELAGFKGARGALKAAKVPDVDIKPDAITGELLSAADAARGFQRPARREIARRMMSGDIDKANAPYTLLGEAIEEPTRLQRLTGADLPKVVRSKEAVEALRQEWPDFFVESLKRSTTNAEKKLMLNMVDIGQRVRRDPLGFGATNNPGQVVGKRLLSDINRVKDMNKQAGKAIGAYESKLKGQKIPVAHIGDSFLESLDALEIGIDKTGKLDFSDSLIAGQGGRINSLNRVYNRMRRNRNPDALDVHHLKQFVDETVSYGKTVKGLGGKAENTLRGLRKNIKETLEDHFPDYAEANKKYSDTINVLDEIQRLAGKHTDLTRRTAESQLGILSKRLTSTLASRAQLENVIDDIENVISEHGVRNALPGKSDGGVSLRRLNQFANELEKRVGSFAPTSFTGGIEKAAGVVSSVPSSMATGGVTGADVIIEGAKKLKEIRGITEQGAFDSLRNLLKREINQ